MTLTLAASNLRHCDQTTTGDVDLKLKEF